MNEFAADPSVEAQAELHFDAVEATYISLTVRTLSGAEINFPQLQLDLPVRELKCLIFEQNDKFPVDQQKLIKGATTLEDDKTLEAYGLKNGDTIHLVKRLGGTENMDDTSGPQVKIATSNGSNSDVITVVVPDNARPGTRLLINPPGREQMSVVVPNGVGPGDRFQVRIPPPSTNTNSSRSRLSMQRTQQTPPPPTHSSGGTIMQVQCPSNARGGQQILIEVPGRGRMRVQVPNGVMPGQTFRFRVPG